MDKYGDLFDKEKKTFVRILNICSLQTYNILWVFVYMSLCRGYGMCNIQPVVLFYVFEVLKEEGLSRLTGENIPEALS